MGELGLKGKLLALAAGATLAVAAGRVESTPGSPPTAAKPAAEARAGHLVIRDAWSRPTPPGITVGVVYLAVANQGTAADRLEGAATPRAKRVEFHETREAKGTMQMRQVGAIDCPAGGTVRSAPGGLHIMLLEMAEPLLAGTEFPITLRFQHAGAVTVTVRVDNRSS